MANFCGKCGTRLDPTTGLCPNCEQKTIKPDEIAKTPKTDKKSGKSKIVIPVVAAVLAILLGVGAYFLFRKPDVAPQTDIADVWNKEEQILTYDNGDRIFIPALENIITDEKTGEVFFNNNILVYLFERLSEEEEQKLADSVDGEIVGDIDTGTCILQIKIEPTNLPDIIEKANKLAEDERVIYAGSDRPIKIIKNDKNNKSKNESMDWWSEAIGAYNAWSVEEKGSTVKVGILDNGFDLDHNEFDDNISMLDGYKNSENIQGTHVAGIIGAANNNIGISGIAGNADMICVDWSPETNDETSENYVTYLTSALFNKIQSDFIEANINVINNSWSSAPYSKSAYAKRNGLSLFEQHISMSDIITDQYDMYMKEYKETVRSEALSCMNCIINIMCSGKNDFIIVQAAGDGYIDENNKPLGKGCTADNGGYYAAIDEEIFNMLPEEKRMQLEDMGITYDTVREHILIVGAVKNSKDKNGNYKMTDFSNYGDNVDICAPGKNIYSTAPNGEYCTLDGTSTAAPMVTGCVAAIWSQDPGMSASEVREKLLESSSGKAIGVGDNKGALYPMLNIKSYMDSLNGSNNDTPEVVLSPEEAVEIYMNNESVWNNNRTKEIMADNALVSQQSISFIDLDFDGILELELSLMQGSGYYTSKYFYKIDPDDLSVKEIKYPNELDREAGMDDIKYLYKNNNDGTMVYYGTDVERCSAMEWYTRDNILEYKNGTVNEVSLFSVYGYCETKTYYYFDNGSEITVSEQEYNDKKEEFRSQYTDMHFSRKYVPYSVFAGKSSEITDGKAVSTLLEAYKSFRYDGFSFDEPDIKAEDVFAFWQEANKTYEDWEVSAFIDRSDSVHLESGYYYRVKHDSISSFKDLTDYLGNYFDEYTYRNIINQYIDYNGYLYSREYCSEYAYGLITGYTVEIDNDKITLTLSVENKGLEYDINPSITYTLNYKNDKWIFVGDFCAFEEV